MGPECVANSAVLAVFTQDLVSPFAQLVRNTERVVKNTERIAAGLAIPEQRRQVARQVPGNR